jgi:hypothetical protein
MFSHVSATRPIPLTCPGAEPPRASPPSGLRVADELADVLLRDPSTGQKLDQVAVSGVGTNFFRPERPATPDIWIRTPGPDTDSRSLPADLL